MSQSIQSAAYPDPRPLPLQNIIYSYLYKEYSDDDDLQAFVSSFNTLSQSYLDWFNQTPLSVYTSSNISGALLDWVGNGIYGIPRPVLSSQVISVRSGYAAFAYNTQPYNSLQYQISGTSALASDDIYKRVMTWNLYRGDGQDFSLFWLKNRISRFLNGPNGSDYPVLNDPPSVTLAASTFTISVTPGPIATALQQCLQNGSLIVPFQYQFVVANWLYNDDGVLGVLSGANYPTNATGLSAGAIWSNGGSVTVVPGITPDPSAPPVFFVTESAAALLSLGGGNLPLANPGAGTGILWNNGGSVSVA